MTAISCRVTWKFRGGAEPTVDLDSRTTGNLKKFEEILLFSCTATHHLVTMGEETPHEAMLLALLLVNSRNALQHLGAVPPDADSGVAPDGRRWSKKAFVADMTFDCNTLGFRHETEGFRLFAKENYSHYTQAVIGLLKSLSADRIEDKVFLTALSQVASEIGQRYIRGEIAADDYRHSARLVSLQAAGRLTLEQCETGIRSNRQKPNDNHLTVVK